MQAILIHEDSKTESIKPENGKDFSLQELYKLLNCELVEIVYIRNSNKILIIDEEGKLKPNPILNLKATQMCPPHTIVGKAVLCNKSMFK